jgi:Leucine-rich repeat (LRR) protein
MKKFFCLFIVLTLLTVPCLTLADLHGRHDSAEAKAYIGRTDLAELFTRKNEDYPFELVLPDWVRSSLTEMEIYEEIYKKVGIDLKEEVARGRLSVRDGKYYINFREKKIEKEVIRDLKEYGVQIDEVSLLDAVKVTGLNLSDFGIKSIIDLKFLINCRILHINKNALITEYEALKYLPNLMILSLNENDISDITFLNYINKSIDTISLCNNKIEDISRLSEFTSISLLLLSNNYIASLKGLENLKKLEDLAINGNFITIESLKYIEDLCYSEILRKLYIDRKIFGEYGKRFALYPEYLQWIDRIFFYEDDGSVTEWCND